MEGDGQAVQRPEAQEYAFQAYRRGLLLLAWACAFLAFIPVPFADVALLVASAYYLKRVPVQTEAPRNGLLFTAMVLVALSAVVDITYYAGVDSLSVLVLGYAGLTFGVVAIAVATALDAGTSEALVRYQNRWYWVSLFWFVALIAVAVGRQVGWDPTATDERLLTPANMVVFGVQMVSLVLLTLTAVAMRRDVYELPLKRQV